MKLEYRRFQGGDEESLSALYSEVFGRTLPKDYWEWKYFRNPAGEHDAHVAVADGRIVGEVGSIPVGIKLGSEEVVGSQTCDIVIAEQYRKGTPFFRLHKAATEEVDRRGWACVYGVSIESTYRIATKMLQFTGAGPIQKLVKIINPTRFLQERLGLKVGTEAAGALGAIGLRMVDRLKGKSRGRIQIKKVDAFDSAFDELWRARRNDFEIMIVRDSAYLTWRFLQNPIQEYDAFLAERDGAPAGFVITCMRREGEFNRGYIVDLLAPPEEGVIESLLACAYEGLFQQRADVVTLWLLEHTLAFAVAKRAGFKPRETPHDLIVRGHGKWDTSYFTDRSRWFLTMGDSDNY